MENYFNNLAIQQQEFDKANLAEQDIEAQFRADQLAEYREQGRQEKHEAQMERMERDDYGY